MHRCMKTAGLKQDEEKKSLCGSCVVCLQICSVYFFSVSVNIHSSRLAKRKLMFQFSHAVTNCIFRLLIYCNIPCSEKSVLLRNILCSSLTEPCGLQANKDPKSSAAPLLYTHRQNLMSFTLLNVCGWRY